MIFLVEGSMKKWLVIVIALCIAAEAAAEVRRVPKGFVEISGDRFIPDLRYNTDDNFLHRNVYAKLGVDRCWLQPDAASRLMRLTPALEKKHLKIVLWDCYRPNAVQKEMWRLVPDPRYVADPKKGSNHNRGMAADLTLADERGNLIPMPTAFDDFSQKAAPSYKCEPKEKSLCRNRDRLINLMKQAGFEPFATEWWHYQPTGVDLEKYPVK